MEGGAPPERRSSALRSRTALALLCPFLRGAAPPAPTPAPPAPAPQLHQFLEAKDQAPTAEAVLMLLERLARRAGPGGTLRDSIKGNCRPLYAALTARGRPVPILFRPPRLPGGEACNVEMARVLARRLCGGEGFCGGAGAPARPAAPHVARRSHPTARHVIGARVIRCGA